MTKDIIEWERMPSLPGVHLRRTTSLTSSKITSSSGEVLLTRRGKTLTLADGRVLQIDKRFPDRWQVNDSLTGDRVIWICNRHYDRKATGYVIFSKPASSQDFGERNRDLMFPVREAGALMR